MARGVAAGLEGEQGFAGDLGAIAGEVSFAIDGDRAAGDLDPGVAAGREGVIDGDAFLEAADEDAGILGDDAGAGFAIGGGDEAELVRELFRGQDQIVMAGWDAELGGFQPDLEEVNGFFGTAVEFTVGEAGAGAHALETAGGEEGGGAGGVFVGEGAIEDPGDDLHIAVGVGAEAGAGHDDVVVDDPEGAEAHVFGVIIAAEGEGVFGIEPADAGEATIVCIAFGDHFIAPSIVVTTLI